MTRTLGVRQLVVMLVSFVVIVSAALAYFGSESHRAGLVGPTAFPSATGPHYCSLKDASYQNQSAGSKFKVVSVDVSCSSNGLCASWNGSLICHAERLWIHAKLENVGTSVQYVGSQGSGLPNLQPVLWNCQTTQGVYWAVSCAGGLLLQFSPPVCTMTETQVAVPPGGDVVLTNESCFVGVGYLVAKSGTAFFSLTGLVNATLVID